MQALLENLELLAKHDMAGLRRACGVDEEDLTDMLSELRTLDPKPGSSFDDGAVEYVSADVTMRPKQGRRLGNRTQQRHPAEGAGEPGPTTPRFRSTPTAKKTGRSCRRNSTPPTGWSARLDQRARTILKVSTEIVRRQDAFFRHGVSHLKPLVLADVAEAVKMHESTISRVTTNKYMATPRGLFELKYFFTTAINSTDGEDAHSAESVRHKIKLLIDNESPKSILSDDKIVKILRDDGVDIARRTVAKYRDSLKIPSSVERRRMKRAMALTHAHRHRETD